MDKLKALLLLLLICSLQLVSGGPLGLQRSTCCAGTTKVKLPLYLIRSYRWTSSYCPVAAVIFRMINGKQICVDPEAPWLVNHMKAVDLKSANTPIS
ncbi:monocyte chemotactic protein 1B-like [Trichomycterus rosablanca]|uniref:monocyte chemotactic protein 1B-like n=1 Tax=Trichomycterus rosablanca TaxID=2290929 RepID=UPI002F35DE4F